MVYESSFYYSRSQKIPPFGKQMLNKYIGGECECNRKLNTIEEM